MPLNWALTARDCEFILGAARRWPPNMAALNQFANLLTGANETQAATEARLANPLAADEAACRPDNLAAVRVRP